MYCAYGSFLTYISFFLPRLNVILRDESRSSRSVVLERRRDLLLGLQDSQASVHSENTLRDPAHRVVAGKTMNTRLDENKAELGVLSTYGAERKGQHSDA